MDVLVSTGEGVGKEQDTKVAIFRKTDENYQLKLKASRAFLSEEIPTRRMENENESQDKVMPANCSITCDDESTLNSSRNFPTLEDTVQKDESSASERDQGKTLQPESIPEKDENQENVKENSEKKQRRRSKIPVSTNQAQKEQKVTGKQSLIRRSIFKTDVKSSAKLAKPQQLNAMKRSSVLPRNLTAAQKRQTIAPLSKISAPLAKPNPVPVVKVHQPFLKKRQTLAPSVGNPSGSVQKSTKGILSTKNPPTVNKSPKFLHPNDVKPKDFECKVCRKKFRTALMLEKHAKSHEMSKSGFVCKYCDRRFEIKKGLDNHIQKYCTKMSFGEKRRLLEEETKNNALIRRTKRLIKASSSAASAASSGVDGGKSSASSSSDLMSLLKRSPQAQDRAKKRSVAFSGISATSNRTIKCYKCLKEFVDVFEFSDHMPEHVTN